MIAHPTPIRDVLHLRRQEMLTIAQREHRAAAVTAPTPPWRQQALRGLALLALALGLRV
jgi:hypothetical protein